jgi:rhodanese-related sulfurtransferase
MKKKIKYTIFILLLISITSYAKEMESSSPEPSKIVSELVSRYELQDVDFDYVKKAINKGIKDSAKAILIDVRSEIDYKLGTIPTSLNIPTTKFEEFYSLLDDVPEDKELIIFCGGLSCTQSAIVAKKLKEKGHTNVKVYLAGVSEWDHFSYLEIDTSVVKSYQERNSALLIDIRSYQEYLEETIPGAISIPDSSINKLISRLPIDKKEKIVIFCEDSTFAKSYTIANKLISLDYENVAVYSGGLSLWKEIGLDTVVSRKVNLEDKKEKTVKKEKNTKYTAKSEIDETNTDPVWYKKN